MWYSPTRTIRPAVALLLWSCSSDEPPPEAELAGKWVSTFSSELVALDLDQAGSRITGRAELAPGGARSDYQVKGFLRGAELTLSLVPEGGGDAVALTAALDSDTLKIRLDGGGYSDRYVPLVKFEE